MGLTFVAALIMISCNKSTDTAANGDSLAADRAVIKSMSFDASDLKKVEGGYVVEGDIFLSDEQVCNGANSANVPKEEQWRTFNVVSIPRRVVGIALQNELNTPFWRDVLTAAVNRYQSLGLRLQFGIGQPNSAPAIRVYPIGGTGAQAGFPSSDGKPYGLIYMGTGIQNCGFNTAVTVMAHEIGHCIGFRHTDWFNRSFSCGSGGSEGQQNDGVGAVLIPGTPSGVDAGSWMLSCYSCGGDRPFTNADITALRTLYRP